MLLQITNTETIDSLSITGITNDNTGLFLIIVLIAIGLISYFIFRPNKKDEIEIKPTQPRLINSLSLSEISDCSTSTNLFLVNGLAFLGVTLDASLSNTIFFNPLRWVLIPGTFNE